MSLRLWLPLIGNANNCGNQLATITEQNIIYSSDGAKFKDSGTDSYIIIKNNNLTAATLSKGFTISFSVKLTTVTSLNQCVVCQRTSTGEGLAVFFINNQLRFDVGNSSYTATPTFTTGQWYNIVLFYRGNGTGTSNRQVYINNVPAAASSTAGTLNNTFSNATYMMIGGSSNATSSSITTPNNNARFYLKDFRFYDEIIPILDLPMNDYNYFDTTNLWGYPTLTNFTSSNTPAWDANNHIGAMMSSIGGSGYNGGVSDPTTGYHACWVLIDNIPTIKFQDLNTTHRWLGISKGGIAATQFSGKQYTISFDAMATVNNMKITGGLYYCKSGATSYNFHNGQMSIFVTTNWQHYSYTWPAITDINTDKTVSFYFYGQNNSVQGTSYVRNIQLEIAPGATDYSKTTRVKQPVQNTSPFNYTFEINGSMGGTAENVGYSFNGSNGSLYNSTGLGLTGKSKTVSFWIKTSNSWTWPTASPWQLIFSDASSGMGCGFYYNTEKRFIVSTVSASTYAEGGYYKTNDWNHIVIVYNGDTPSSCYLNNHSLAAKTANNWSASGGLAIGCRQYNGLVHHTNCMIKNFKVFDYQLTEAAVNSLYAAASITPTGQLLCNNFIESNKIKFKRNGVINSSNFSIKKIPIEQAKIKILSDGSLWARIFYHKNYSGQVLFTSLAEILSCNTENKFSLLYLLPQLKASDGKYEFMLDFPSINTTQYNRWKQTNNPCDEFVTQTSDGSGTATGYTAVHIDWTTRYWGGLTRQSSDATSTSNTYLSGSVGHSNWFYAIGATQAWNGGIPAYDPATQETDLWIRLDTLNDSAIFKQFKINNSIGASDFIER